VTDGNGFWVQYLTYLPYGEQYIDYRFKKELEYDKAYNMQNDIRYKFTGKERDKETGYDYI